MLRASGVTGASLPSESAGASPGREFTARIVSAAILAPVVLGAIMWGGVPCALLVTLVALVSFWEWTGITGSRRPEWVWIAALACLAVALLSLAWWQPAGPIVFVLVIALAAFAIGYFHSRSPWVGVGLLYVAIPCAGFIILRRAEPSGWAAVLFILLVVWATDIGAYFAGRQFGGPKLWPRVSPKKTWSGAIGGLVAGIIAGVVTAALTGVGGIAVAAILAAALSLATQAGDLLESAVKRRFGVKDASQVIPGHGGVLDRVDGLFGASALAWLIAGLGLGGELLVMPAAVALYQGTS